VTVAVGYAPGPEAALTLFGRGFFIFKAQLPPGGSSFRLIMDVVLCTSIRRFGDTAPCYPQFAL
jgi:hypothetical protein